MNRIDARTSFKALPSQAPALAEMNIDKCIATLTPEKS